MLLSQMEVRGLWNKKGEGDNGGMCPLRLEACSPTKKTILYPNFVSQLLLN